MMKRMNVITRLLIVTLALTLAFMVAPAAASDHIPEHSLYLGDTAVSVQYLMNDPVNAENLVNGLIADQDLVLSDLFYQVHDEPVKNVATDEPATQDEINALKAALRWYYDENGVRHPIIYAIGMIQVGTQGFNDVHVNDVICIPDATHFSVSVSGTVREIGGDDPVTFVGTGETTLQIMNADKIIIATGTLAIPDEVGVHSFIVYLELRPVPDAEATGIIRVGAMNFNEVYVNPVESVPGATHFSVSHIDTVREIDGGDPVTFVGTGETTLQIMNADKIIIATGTLHIPGEVGEYPFVVDLELEPVPDPKATGIIWVGAMNVNEVYVNAVEGVPGATRFSVSDSGTVREIGGGDPVTFVGTGETTLQIMDAGATILATCTLAIPPDVGEHEFIEVDLDFVI